MLDNLNQISQLQHTRTHARIVIVKGITMLVNATFFPALATLSPCTSRSNDIVTTSMPF